MANAFMQMKAAESQQQAQQQAGAGQEPGPEGEGEPGASGESEEMGTAEGEGPGVGEETPEGPEGMKERTEDLAAAEPGKIVAGTGRQASVDPIKRIERKERAGEGAIMSPKRFGEAKTSKPDIASEIRAQGIKPGQIRAGRILKKAVEEEMTEIVIEAEI
jgi:hypothetical protein